MRVCREVSSRYTLADKVHVDMYLEVQATSERVEASFARANELRGRHERDGIVLGQS